MPEFATMGAVDTQTLSDLYAYVVSTRREAAPELLFQIRSFTQYRVALANQQNIESIMSLLPPEGTDALDPQQTLEDIRNFLTAGG